MKLDDATPKKDVIYIDIEDDITSIIDKVTHSSQAIVALVPPKRIGALQSVVNLKLLDRAATSAKKRVVLITNDHALTALAAGVAMPVAKNLQSKPEVAVVDGPTDAEDEVIDGEEIAVATTVDTVNDEPVAESVTEAAANHEKRTSSRRSGISVPNFDAFRNKLALIGGGALLIVGFLVWAIIFAPHAKITITAKTTPYGVNKLLSATAGGQLNPDTASLNAVTKEVKKTVTVDFTATGKKDVGDKATGPVSFSNSTFAAKTVSAGTKLTTDGDLTFTLDASVTVPAATFPCGNIFCATPGTANGTVTALEPGTKYNTASGSLSGAGTGLTAKFTSAASGGTDKTVTVVSEEDAASAKDKLQTQDANAVKAELKKQFASDVVAVEESYTVTPGNPIVAPAVGQEATAAKLSVETTYTMIGFARSDVRAIVEQDLKKQLAGIPNQSIYDAGMDSLRFTGYSLQDKTYKVTIQTTGAVGPSIDSTTLAKQLVGKREGEIQQLIKTYEGIKSVDVAFSPFWVTTAPSSDKITISFQIDNAKH